MPAAVHDQAGPHHRDARLLRRCPPARPHRGGLRTRRRDGARERRRHRSRGRPHARADAVPRGRVPPVRGAARGPGPARRARSDRCRPGGALLPLHARDRRRRRSRRRHVWSLAVGFRPADAHRRALDPRDRGHQCRARRRAAGAAAPLASGARRGRRRPLRHAGGAHAHRAGPGRGRVLAGARSRGGTGGDRAPRQAGPPAAAGRAAVAHGGGLQAPAPLRLPGPADLLVGRCAAADLRRAAPCRGTVCGGPRPGLRRG